MDEVSTYYIIGYPVQLLTTGEFGTTPNEPIQLEYVSTSRFHQMCARISMPYFL